MHDLHSPLRGVTTFLYQHQSMKEYMSCVIILLILWDEFMINSVVAFQWLNMLITIAFFGRLAYRYIIVPIIIDQKNDIDAEQQRLNELKNTEIEIHKLKQVVSQEQHESNRLCELVETWNVVREQEWAVARTQFEQRLKMYQEKIDRRYMIKQDQLMLASTVEKAISEAKAVLEDRYRDPQKGRAYLDALLKAGVSNETRA